MGTRESVAPLVFSNGGHTTQAVQFRFGDSGTVSQREAAFACTHPGRAGLIAVKALLFPSPATAPQIRDELAAATGGQTEIVQQNAVRQWSERLVAGEVFTVTHQGNKNLYSAGKPALDAVPLIAFFDDFENRYNLSVQRIFGKANGPPETDTSQLRRVRAIRFIAKATRQESFPTTESFARSLGVDTRRPDIAKLIARNLAMAGLFKLDSWSVTESTVFTSNMNDSHRPKLTIRASEELRGVIAYADKEGTFTRQDLHDHLCATIPHYEQRDSQKQQQTINNILNRLESGEWLEKIHGRYTDGLLAVSASEKQQDAMDELIDGIDAYAGRSQWFADEWGPRAFDLIQQPDELARIYQKNIDAHNGRTSTGNLVARVLDVIRTADPRQPLGCTAITEQLAAQARSGEQRPYGNKAVGDALNKLLQQGAVAAVDVGGGSGFILS
ncbi:hypothetical protein CSA80_05125 [Candidatus Saccharibacteria bacterium]|nr:MAG: hypothetical protein CR973_01270 [Candidatus Saccharibacteria bacterium]PID98714.1 MAG: hypothetical protein CSA80_05125 [Candidatus Saccharibacteria bacterium]